jgi:hypothetical protein
LDQFSKIYTELFAQKIVTKLSKIWVWDPGVKKAPDPGSANCKKTIIVDPNPVCSAPFRWIRVELAEPDPPRAVGPLAKIRYNIRKFQ